MAHVPEYDLLLFSLDPAACEQRREIETHLAGCSECAAEVDFMRATEGDLRDEDVWERTLGSETLRSLRALADRIGSEDAEADVLLRQFLAAPAATAWTKIHTRKKYLTGGVVRRLTDQAHRVCEAEPLDALTFADAAISVADMLPDDSYPARAVYELRGTAWKERANALRLLGRFDEALASLTRAERAYRQLASSALGLSSVGYVRATVLFEQQRLDEAATAAEAAEKGFAHLGDENRRLAALYLRADIRYEAHDYATALSLFQQILTYGETVGDSLWIARAASGLGNCHVDRNDAEAAVLQFHRALTLFTELQQPAHAARAEWGIGRTLLLAGKHRDAVVRLRLTVAQLESRGMVTDAALASLDMADALLALGELRTIAELMTHLFTVFMNAGMLTGALTAMAYLEDAASTGVLHPRDVATVRAFFRRAERQPDLVFKPPA